jgi:putative hemolysin
MLAILTIIAVLASMIFFNALYVAGEFATVSSRRTRVSQMAGQGNRMAQLLLPILTDTKRLDTYVATCQIGITISSLVVGAYGQNVIAARLYEPVGELLAILPNFSGNIDGVASTAAESISATLVLIMITTLQVIMGELFPKSVAIQYPERVAMALVIPMRISQFILTPLITIFNGSGNIILRLLRQKKEKSSAHSPEEIELLVTESHENALLTDDERLLLRNAFRLRDLVAKQVMIHRTKIVAASLDSEIVDVINLAIDAGFSRIPLYKESIDDIQGFVHIKDLFRLHVQGKNDLSTVLRELVFVPESMKVLDLWERLDAGRKYLAAVFDEYGGVAGLITFEDLIEEVFGELQDEFDDEMALISRDKNGRLYLRGDLLVSDVNEYLELELPQDNADTLSGLVFSLLGRPPEVGDQVEVGNTVLRVETLDDPGISEISIELPPTDFNAPFIEWEVADHD